MSSRQLALSLARECEAIRETGPALKAKAQAHLDSLAKPVGSLGRLEELAARLFAIQQSAPLRPGPARMYTIAADHGVVEEGVASSPQAVTLLMARTFLQGGAAINCLCAAAGAELRIVDAGVATPLSGQHELLIRANMAPGTANMAKGPAMTREQCLQALHLGIELAQSAHADGIRVLGTGEMGIGNTTASSALLCAFFGFSPEEMTGMGAGVPSAGLGHKSKVIQQALSTNREAVNSGDPIAVLAALGGLEIAALAGLVLGGAARRMPVVIDGFISTAAYAAAWKLQPAVRDYCFFSHASAEAGHAKALEALGERALLDLGLRLGEGTGAALGFMLLKAAAEVFNSMATLKSAGIHPAQEELGSGEKTF